MFMRRESNTSRIFGRSFCRKFISNAINLVKTSGSSNNYLALFGSNLILFSSEARQIPSTETSQNFLSIGFLQRWEVIQVLSQTGLFQSSKGCPTT